MNKSSRQALFEIDERRDEVKQEAEKKKQSRSRTEA